MRETEHVTCGLLAKARSTPFHIAPEKAQSLVEEVFDTKALDLRGIQAEATFFAVVPNKTIYASYAGMASLWCLSFVAFCVADLSSRETRSDANNGEQIDISEFWHSLKLDEYLNYSRRLIHADEPWPENICQPVPEAELNSTEGRVNNLFFGALSWILLHEIGHVHHKDVKLIPNSQSVSQEFHADAFATKWVLDEAGNGIMREFRVLAVTVALAWLFLHEQVKGIGSDHPAAVLRFKEAINQFNVGKRSVGLENATYIMKAIFDPKTEMPTRMLSAEAFEWMCHRLEVIFSHQNETISLRHS